MRFYIFIFLTFVFSFITGYFVGDYIPNPLKVEASDLGLSQLEFDDLINIQTRHREFIKFIEEQCGTSARCQQDFLNSLEKQSQK